MSIESARKEIFTLKEYNRPVLFFGLSVSIPWILWSVAGYISHSQHLNQRLILLESIIGIIGLLTPMVTAFALMLPNRRMRDDLLHQIIDFSHARPIHYIAAFLLLPVSILVAQAVSLLFGYSASQFEFVKGFSFTAGMFPAWFLLIIAPAIEELGWHTYGTNCLRNKMNLTASSLIFGAFWGIWHMPLSLIKGYYQSNVVMEGALYSVNFLLSLIPFVIIMNWLYYKTKRNLFIAIIFHMTAGFSGEIFQTHSMSKVIQTLLLLILSAIIIFNDRDFFFKRDFQ